MSGFVTALTGEGGLSSASLWSDVTSAAPLLLVVIGFSFGYLVVRKIITGVANKGKVKM